MQAQTCWDRAVESAGGLEARQAALKEFNERSRFRKRGLAMTPTKFGISFTTKFLNQVRLKACTHLLADGELLSVARQLTAHCLPMCKTQKGLRLHRLEHWCRSA